MPRRRGGGGFSRPAPKPSVPARPAPTQPAPMQAAGQPRQPGLMAQMAATAGGVAIGSAVGHTIGHAMTGGGGSGQEVAQPAGQYQQPYEQQMQNPCQMELDRFLECSKVQSDLSLCYGFNEALKECKMRYNMP